MDVRVSRRHARVFFELDGRQQLRYPRGHSIVSDLNVSLRYFQVVSFRFRNGRCNRLIADRRFSMMTCPGTAPHRCARIRRHTKGDTRNAQINVLKMNRRVDVLTSIMGLGEQIQH